MPGPCISCHGGRGDALMPPDASGKQKFNLVQNGVSKVRGDVQGHMHPFEPDVFGFSDAAGFTRPEQEAAIKKINSWLLCTYPLSTPSTAPEDACRRQAGGGEWAGTAADLIKSAYGGDGLPNAKFVDSYVPPSWAAAGQTTLYQKVVAPACRTCHIMRGTALQSDLDFTSYEKFLAYSDRIKAHIVDRGNMPLAKIVYEAFYGTPDRPESIASFLAAQGFSVRDAAGVALKPGRPVADPGPPRVVPQGTTTISGAGSLYASGYQWTLVSGPANGATLSNTSSQQATFTATQDGTYVVQLVVTGNNLQSAAVQTTIVVNNTLPTAPSAIRFSDIKAVLQSTTAGCTASGCHSSGGPVSAPLFYTTVDRNGDGVIDAVDDNWFYTEVRSRINFTDIVASPLLRKPSGNHHNGQLRPGFNTTAAPGQPERASYDLFLNWILNGAPQ
jgi:mono/diheme cytochrome c family protein